jgi:hypothetical protein
MLPTVPENPPWERTSLLNSRLFKPPQGPSPIVLNSIPLNKLDNFFSVVSLAVACFLVVVFTIGVSKEFFLVGKTVTFAGELAFRWHAGRSK